MWVFFFFSDWHWPEPDASARAIKRCRPKLPDRRPPPWTLPTARRLSVSNTKFEVACATFQIITATMHARVLGITSGERQPPVCSPPCYRRGLHADAEVVRLPLPSYPRGVAASPSADTRPPGSPLPCCLPVQCIRSRFADSERFWRTEQHCRLLFLLVRSCSEVEPGRVFSAARRPLPQACPAHWPPIAGR